MRSVVNSYTSLLSGLASIVVFLWLHPLILTYGDTRFLGGSFGDGGLYVWLVKLFVADPWQALHFETNSMYPYPLSRAWSDSFLLPSLLVSLLTFFGISVALAYNVVLICAIALNGASSSLLASTLGFRPIGAFAAGLMVANSSYFIGNAGHPQLLFFFWIPLAWSTVLSSPVDKRSTSRRWLYAGLYVSGAFYSAVYYAIFATLGLALIWLLHFLGSQMSQRKALRTLLLAALGASPIIYALRYYLAVQAYFGERGPYEAAAFAASGLSYFSFSPLNEIYGQSAVLSHSEAFLCPGYVILALALVTACIAAWQQSRLITACSALAVIALCISSSIIDVSMFSEYLVCTSSWLLLLFAFWLSLSGRSSIGIFAALACLFFTLSFGPGGDSTKHEPTFAPFGVLYAVAPGLGSIRAVGRFGSVAILGLILGGVYGCLRLTASRPRLTNALIALLTGITLAENSISAIPLDSISATPMAFDIASKKGTRGDAVLALPFGGKSEGREIRSWSDLAIVSSQYSQWALDSSITLVNGYSGQRTKLQSELARVTHSFPSKESFEYLARICGLRWVVISPHLYSSWDEESFMRRLAELSSFTSEVLVSPDKSIAIRLANTAISIGAAPDQEPLILTGPSPAPIRVAISPTRPSLADSACMITTEIPRKIGSDARVTFTLPTGGFSGLAPSFDPERFQVLSRENASRAAPTLLRVTASGCAPRISCDSQQSAR